MNQQINISLASRKPKSKPVCTGQLKIEFSAQEEIETTCIGLAYPSNIIRISQYCSDILDKQRTSREEVPFRVMPGRRRRETNIPAFALRSMFG